jgi:hypothetical protein
MTSTLAPLSASINKIIRILNAIIIVIYKLMMTAIITRI